MAQSISRDSIQKAVGEILKRVDEFIKSGDLQQALLETDRAAKIDPGNVYVRAYQERIFELRRTLQNKRPMDINRKGIGDVKERSVEEQGKLDGERHQSEVEKPTLDEARKNSEEAAGLKEKEKQDEERRKLEDARKSLEEAARRKEEERRKRELEKEKQDEERRKLEDARRSLEEATRRKEEERQKRTLEKEKQDEERRKLEDARRSLEEAARRKEEERRNRELENEKQYKERRKLEEAFKLEEEQRRREETRKYDEERRKLDEELIRQKEESRKLEEERRKDTRKISAFVQSQSDAHSIYRSALVSGWANGVPTGERKTKLDDLRSALGISMEEHAELEKEVKHQTYMEAFKRIWVPSGKASSGWDDDLWRQALKRARSAPFITPARAAVLDQLREKFQVSTEEHLQIEAKLLAEIQTTSRKPTVVVIDDDEEFLQVVVATLEDAGLGTKAFTTSDEAFEMLKTSNPDLILCDINLPKSTMGGFTFYEKLKQLQHLKFVPFIFLTGYSDESLARKGKELGVDDFLTKPFNDSHLISTIKGKIRRYRELRSK